MSNDAANLRDFLFRGLMFEAEAVGFQSAGIQVGADTSQAEERLLSEALSPFNVTSRNNALEMARLYSVLHCFENEVRALIRETLQEKEGPDWVDKLPKKSRILPTTVRKRLSKIHGLRVRNLICWVSWTSDSSLRLSSRNGRSLKASSRLSIG